MEPQTLKKLEKSLLGSRWKEMQVWIKDRTLFFSPNVSNEKATKGFQLAGCSLEVSDKTSQRTGLFFHTVSGHRFTVVRKQTKHIFACDSKETLQQWTAALKINVAEVNDHTPPEEAAADSDAKIKELMGELNALKMKNTALKLKSATKKAQAALKDENVSKTDKIKFLMTEMELLEERNAQLKNSSGLFDDITAEEAAEIKALLLKLNAAKLKNTQLKTGMTTAEIAGCFEAARLAKNAQIEQLMKDIDELKATNYKLKNPAEEEDDVFPEAPADYDASPRSRKGKKNLLRYSMSNTIKSVTHISEPVCTGKLKKRSTGLVKRWNARYFEVGDGKLMAYTNESKNECKGELSLADAIDVKQEKKNIVLTMTGGDLVLLANNANGAKKWVAAFEGVIAK